MLDPRLAGLIKWCLLKEPRRRPQNAAAAHRLLMICRAEMASAAGLPVRGGGAASAYAF